MQTTPPDLLSYATPSADVDLPATDSRRSWKRLRKWCTWRNLLIAVFIVHLLPIWIVTYFPTQDGPAHIYNGRIFFASFDHSNYQIRQHYQFGYELFPNMLTHLMLGALQQIVPPLIAEKLVLSVLVSFVPLSMLYLLNSIQRGRGVICLIGFTFAYHNLLHIGFYNFSLSVSMCLFTLGWWWRYRDSMTFAKLGVFYALAALTYVSHFAGYMAAVMAITIAIGWMALLRGLKALIQCRRGAFRSDLMTLTRWAFSMAAIMLPLWAIGWDYTFRNYRPEHEDYRTLAYLNEIFWQTLTLMSYSEWHLKLAPFILWTTVSVAGLTVLYRLARLKVLEERDALLLIAAALVYLFFTLPWSKNDGGWVNDRLYIIAFLIVWAWFGGFHKWVNVIIGIALIAISLAHTGRLTYDYRRLQPELRELAAATDMIKPHSTVSWELNGGFRPAAFPEGTELVNPWLHALSYYGMKKDVALFSNYEAGYSYFLTKWGEAPRRDADYIVAFGQSSGGDRSRRDRSRQQYELLHESTNFALYQRKQNPPDTNVWSTLPDGRRTIRLQMVAKDSDTTRGVGRDRLYTSGSFGWVRTVPRNAWRSTNQQTQYKSLVGDIRDRAFRIDLPNGRYDVTCYFAPHPLGSYETNLIANDKPIGRILSPDPAPDADAADKPDAKVDPTPPPPSPPADPLTLHYVCDITDGQLTQVFYTTAKGSPDPRQQRIWAISGIEIIEIISSATQPTSPLTP